MSNSIHTWAPLKHAVILVSCSICNYGDYANDFNYCFANDMMPAIATGMISYTPVLHHYEARALSTFRYIDEIKYRPSYYVNIYYNVIMLYNIMVHDMATEILQYNDWKRPISHTNAVWYFCRWRNTMADEIYIAWAQWEWGEILTGFFISIKY